MRSVLDLVRDNIKIKASDLLGSQVDYKIRYKVYPAINVSDSDEIEIRPGNILMIIKELIEIS